MVRRRERVESSVWSAALRMSETRTVATAAGKHTTRQADIAQTTYTGTTILPSITPILPMTIVRLNGFNKSASNRRTREDRV